MSEICVEYIIMRKIKLRYNIYERKKLKAAKEK